MKGFVLAAGFGTRMRPISSTLPKPLFPVGDTPLIGHALASLSRHGVRHVMVNTHHLAHIVEDTLGDGSRYGVDLQVSRESEILGTGGGIKAAEAFLDESFVVVTSDVVTDIDFHDALAMHRRLGALATMVVRDQPNHPEFGALAIDEEGMVRRILGEGAAPDDLMPVLFTGCHIMEPRFLEYLPPNAESCVIRDGYQKALSNQERICGFRHHGLWLDAGTPEHYLEANRWWLDGHIASTTPDDARGRAGVGVDDGAAIDSDVVLAGPLKISATAEVDEGARVGPHVMVHRHARIGKGAVVRNTVVLNGATIAPGETVTDAIVGETARIQTA